MTSGEGERIGRVPRWALPGELAALDGWRRRRTVRDWLVDATLFGFALVVWLIEWDDLDPLDPRFAELVPNWMITIDPWVGIAACLALWWRRRFPLGFAIAMVPALMVSNTALGAVLVSVLTVAIHRGLLPAGLVTAAQLAQATTFVLGYEPGVVSVVTVFLLFATPLGWGFAVRVRRQLVVSLRRDAERQRREHQLRLAQTRRAERERIAREMHDVLAHRISLLSVHAGALAYRTAQTEAGAGTPLTSEEVAEAVTVIRDSAHQALVELGEVLTVLRSDEPEDARGAPQPRLADLPRLVAEARAAGQQVRLELDPVLSQPPAPRPQEQRTVYRVVQEGLTNARKHAPDTAVAVSVRGTPGADLEVAVINALPAGARAARIPGAGAGLTGLAERVALDGGRLRHGPAGGAFQLLATLPWRT